MPQRYTLAVNGWLFTELIIFPLAPLLCPTRYTYVRDCVRRFETTGWDEV